MQFTEAGVDPKVGQIHSDMLLQLSPLNLNCIQSAMLQTNHTRFDKWEK